MNKIYVFSVCKFSNRFKDEFIGIELNDEHSVMKDLNY